MPKIFALMGFFWLVGLTVMGLSMAFDSGSIWMRVMSIFMSAAMGCGAFVFLSFVVKSEDGWLP